jgi:uncharacterized protein YciI
MPYFVVINDQGPSWIDAHPMREQALWKEHADFINALSARGFVLLGGPIGSGDPHRAMLIVHSEGLSTVRVQLDSDPWIKAGILRIASIEPWKILVSNDRLDPALAEITGAAPPG